MHLPWKDDYFFVADWIAKNINGKIFGDIGCGNAFIISNLFRNNNKEVWGIDGSDHFKKFVDKDILGFTEQVDLTQKNELKKADVAICLEVAEHIAPESSDIIVENIVSTSAKTIIFTAASPGQEGINHINLKPRDFWIAKFLEKGYEIDENISDKFKLDLGGKINNLTWYVDNIMIFRKIRSAEEIRNSKLVMTLLVRDEEDIIEENIKFHLNQGVDFIIATDNGSVDKTRKILEKYEKKGALMIIDEPKQDYSQMDWVNRMGKIAFEKYKADAIFHCDADEFWFAKNGSLKDEIAKIGQDVLIVNLINVLLEDRNGNEKFPESAIYAVTNPAQAANLMNDSKNKNLYLFKYPPKVMFKTEKGLLNVTQGNHSISKSDKKTKRITQKKSENIVIYHFPIRSKSNFFTKVINGGKSYENNKKFDESVGFHWRRWYKSYREDGLEDEYKKIILTKDKARKLIEGKIVSKFSFREIV